MGERRKQVWTQVDGEDGVGEGEGAGRQPGWHGHPCQSQTEGQPEGGKLCSDLPKIDVNLRSKLVVKYRGY